MVKEISGDSYQDFERWNLQIQPPFSQFLAYLVKSDHWLHKILFLQRFWMSRLKNKYCTCIPFLMKGMVYNNVRKIVNYPHTCTCFIIMNQYRFCFTTPIIASNYLKYQSMYSVTIKSILCRTIKSLLPYLCHVWQIRSPELSPKGGADYMSDHFAFLLHWFLLFFQFHFASCKLPSCSLQFKE